MYEPDAWEKHVKIKNFAKIYSKVGWTGYRQRNREAIEAITAANALDAGCFAGEYSECFVGEYTGIDITPKFIAEAKKYYPDKKFLCCDVRNLPYKDRAFELVFCFGLIIHLPSPLHAIAELWRVTDKILLLEANTSDIPMSRLEMGGEGSHFNDFSYNKKWLTHLIEETTGTTPTLLPDREAALGYAPCLTSTLWKIQRDY